MDNARFDRLHELFTAAQAVPAAQRRAFVAERTADDPSLADEVLELLQNDAAGDTAFMARMQHVVGGGEGGLPAREHPAWIGPYRIVKVLGEGGMGMVYEAVQTEPVERRVAIKLIKADAANAELVQRFERERQALAMMQHDGIAKVHECGTTETGEPYLVMELVSGIPITEYCKQARLSLPNRIRLVRELCAAIQHAHRKRMVHRDLKPGNVLVADKGGKLRIKVVDFGLAKPVGRNLPVADFKTRPGSTGAGTPAYMAPEQVSGTGDVDTLADVYAIGVILYELLVGSLPLPHEVLYADGEGGMARILRETEPQRPSARLAAAADAAAIAAERRITLAALTKALKRDLDWVALKALEKDPERRYHTADEFATDLRRFLHDEPLVAGPPTASYRFAKFAKRYRAQLLVASTIAVLLLAGGIAIGVYAIAWSRSLHDFDQLAGVVELRRLQAEHQDEGKHPRFADELPGNVEPMAQWLRDATKLLDRRAEFEATLHKLADDASTTTAEGARFLRNALTGLLAELDSLATARTDVERRLFWASRVRDATFSDRPTGPSWQDVRADLATANGEYGSLEFADADVIGLAPIGKHPKTDLWEFYHLRSAWNGVSEPDTIAIPRHDAAGNVPVVDSTGIVFVLLPGDGRLDPFFLARHEVTRAQWERLGGDASTFWHGDEDMPSQGSLAPTMPAEHMDWDSARTLLARHGLALPTEEQWLLGFRAPTTASAGAPAGNFYGDADGYDAIAPVGSFAPNALGLFDMHGNIFEWCRDRFTHPGKVAPRRGDGLREPTDSRNEQRVARGGSFGHVDAGVKIARNPSHRYRYLGVRAARSLR